MKIELREITVRELTDGFQDNAEAGVVGYGGKLDIRPPYQREERRVNEDRIKRDKSKNFSFPRSGR